MRKTAGISIDYVCLEIRQHQSGQRMLFIVIYRPPNSHAELYSRVEQPLESALLMCNELIVVGDFNVDLLHENDNRLTKIFGDAGLEQLVTAPTRECNGNATLIDHLYTTNTTRVVKMLVPLYRLSDHYPICFVYKAGMGKRNKHHHESMCYRNFRHFSSKYLIADLHNIPWSLLNMFD